MQKNSFLKSATICATTIFLHASVSADQEPVYVLEDFTVSAGPAARPISDFVNPISTMDEDAIRSSNASTLGALLNGQPGVTASSFGGGASRPIIRGFAGPRVRIVESGLGSQDVSETSPDHAVSVEPLLVERVEVLRGPSTLLYGSSAIGGVVNVVGRDLPREKPTQQFSGALEGRYDSVSEGETILGRFTFNEGPFVMTVQGMDREADDYEIPSHPEAEPDEPREGDTLESSFVENDFVSAGASWFFNEQDYLGVSFSRYQALYGVPGHEHDHGGGGAPPPPAIHDEEGVAIDLERWRYDAELALFDPIHWIEAFKIHFGYTDYEHKELEEDETAANFLREGWELRAEAAHYEWGFIDQGIFGIQISDTDFEAFGEEIVSGGNFSFGPPSTTRSQALFISEHIHRDAWHFEVGARVENQTIDVEGGDDYSDIASSLSLGVIYEIDDVNSVAVSLQRTARHPNSTELYALGPHLATSQYEIGDSDLGLETAYGADITFRHFGERWTLVASAFYTYFEDYIFSQNLGFETDPEGNNPGDVGFDADEALDTYAYGAVEAAFYGFEFDLDYLAYASGNNSLSLGLIADYVHAENRDTDEHLPRIPPLRIGGTIDYTYGNWEAGLLLRHTFSQHDHAADETDTDGFTDLEAELAYAFEINSRSSLTIFARADNLLDEEIRHHTSFIKDEAPRPGRNFILGARYEF